jgi:hypothetical protein
MRFVLEQGTMLAVGVKAATKPVVKMRAVVITDEFFCDEPRLNFKAACSHPRETMGGRQVAGVHAGVARGGASTPRDPCASGAGKSH